MRPSRHVTRIALPLLLLLLAVLPGCSKKTASIIEGEWTVRINFPGNDPSDLFLKFEGDDESGSVYNQKGTLLGSYTLTRPTLKFTVQVFYNDFSGNLVYLFSGALSDDTHMAGTLIGYFSNFPLATLNGTWSGTR
ncbi:MAG: hypothetical protein MUC72_02405 [Acidobacteria bacterium]|jgi:hypothetical protein|nr:hypothetical protein [Acidobacteriota bacterium]